MAKPGTYSMFIGRYQPFHNGHKALIETVLKEGKPVFIAVRDTLITDENPYDYDSREKIIKDSLKDWGDKVIVMKIPDVAEVCYGRGVGWGVREIKLSKDLEDISATKIRKELENE